jgi:hypothetical protein
MGAAIGNGEKLRRFGFVMAAWLWWAGVAAAQEGKNTPAVNGAGEAAAPPAETLDFDLLPSEPPADTRQWLKLESEVHTRRSMLQFHQALGIVTTALMVGTVITGQLDFTDRFGGGTSTGRYSIWHTSFEAASVVGFTGDALLALFAPVPYPKHSQGVDTILIHKIAMFTAAAGFAAEIPLGIYTVSQAGHLNQGTFAWTHLVIGYVTAAAFATGVTALLF